MKRAIQLSIVWNLLTTCAAIAYADKQPVIDVHLHVWAEAWFPAPPHDYVASAQSQQELIDQTLAQMSENNVVLALVHDTPAEMTKLYDRAPERIRMFPDLATDRRIDIAMLASKLESGEWHGIGEIATQYGGLKPTDEFLWPYYDIANRHGAPVFWHTGMSFPGITRLDPEFRADLGRPLHWEDVFVRYPELQAVLVHAGHPYLSEIIAILNIYESVYVDTGAVVHVMPPDDFYRYYGAIIDAGFAKRILFGSDQMGWPESIGYGISLIESAPWDDDVKRDILYNNAARFLALSDEEIEAHNAN